MKHPILKPTVNNIINLWFGADTPIRQYRVRMNPDLWNACERIGRQWMPFAGALSGRRSHKADRVRFAKAVQLALGLAVEPIVS